MKQFPTFAFLALLNLFFFSCNKQQPRVWLKVPNAEYIGTGRCLQCHTIQETSMGKTAHWSKNPFTPYSWKSAKTVNNNQGCESCHGPGSVHIEEVLKTENPAISLIQFGDFSPIVSEQQNDQCLQCHQQNFSSWQFSSHSQHNLSCATCHQVHGDNKKLLNSPSQIELCGKCHKSQKAAMFYVSHHPLREGKMKCTDCHNPHGSNAEADIKANTIPNLCYKCHTKYRGPFLWKHPPKEENCTNCHMPHGSIHNRLLKENLPFLCQRCHNDLVHPGFGFSGRDTFVGNGVGPALQLVGRGCLNCHVQIHGSNHPSGKRFLR